VTGLHAISLLRSKQMRPYQVILSLSLSLSLSLLFCAESRAFVTGVTELDIISRSELTRACEAENAYRDCGRSVGISTAVYRRFLRGCDSMTVVTNEMRVSEKTRMPFFPCRAVAESVSFAACRVLRFFAPNFFLR